MAWLDDSSNCMHTQKITLDKAIAYDRDTVVDERRAIVYLGAITSGEFHFTQSDHTRQALLLYRIISGVSALQREVDGNLLVRTHLRIVVPRGHRRKADIIIPDHTNQKAIRSQREDRIRTVVHFRRIDIISVKDNILSGNTDGISARRNREPILCGELRQQGMRTYRNDVPRIHRETINEISDTTIQRMLNLHLRVQTDDCLAIDRILHRPRKRDWRFKNITLNRIRLHRIIGRIPSRQLISDIYIRSVTNRIAGEERRGGSDRDIVRTYYRLQRTHSNHCVRGSIETLIQYRRALHGQFKRKDHTIRRIHGITQNIIRGVLATELVNNTDGRGGRREGVVLGNSVNRHILATDNARNALDGNRRISQAIVHFRLRNRRNYGNRSTVNRHLPTRQLHLLVIRVVDGNLDLIITRIRRREASPYGRALASLVSIIDAIIVSLDELQSRIRHERGRMRHRIVCHRGLLQLEGRRVKRLRKDHPHQRVIFRQPKVTVTQGRRMRHVNARSNCGIAHIALHDTWRDVQVGRHLGRNTMLQTIIDKRVWLIP